MNDNFHNCIIPLLHYEGGYVNNPSDPGGETNMGISKRAYPSLDIKNLTKELACQIYQRDYWNRVCGDQLPSGLDMVVFDSAVNSGVHEAIIWLQEVLGVTADGVIGNQTLNALQGKDISTLIDKYIALRLAYDKSLSTWNKFGTGWSNRLKELSILAHTFK